MSIHRVEDYHIGWICALSVELAASKAVLDEEHCPIDEIDELDHNNYVLGSIQGHNVVIACLPTGVNDSNAAATVARDLARTFTSVRFSLLVGTGGGIPDLENDIDIRLGDVVVGQPTANHGGIIQFDIHEGLQIKGSLNHPPRALLGALNFLKAEQEIQGSRMPTYLSKMVDTRPKMKEAYGFQGVQKDNLYNSTYHHLPGKNCKSCDALELVVRPSRPDNDPWVHYGTIASGQEVKNAIARDQIRDQCSALCVEMQASGLVNDFPCIVIRGISDYADSHKNETWQRYAAATAAAYGKELLVHVSRKQVSKEMPMRELSDLFQDHLTLTNDHYIQQALRYENSKYQRCLQAFKTSRYEEYKNFHPNAAFGTCRWILEHPQYQRWANNSHDDLLWISADPGCGKSVLSRMLVDNVLDGTVCHFFFKDNTEQDNIATALCALIHQLCSSQPSLLKYALAAWEADGNKIQLEVEKLWQIILNATTDAAAEDVTCVLDGLDECKDDDQRRLIRKLSEFYIERSTSTLGRHSRLKFLVTSRPYSTIQDQFNRIPATFPPIQLCGNEMNDEISKEIDLVVQIRVADIIKALSMQPAKVETIRKQLLGMEHRTYLWLHLAIDDILTTLRNSLRPEEEPISQVPASVEQAYDKILKRIPVGQEEIVMTILQIVIGARRPLTIGEMSLALGIATAKKNDNLADIKLDEGHLKQHIRQWCGLFIYFHNSRIYLIHQTASEYLNKRHTTSQYSFSRPVTETRMTRICLDFLQLREFSDKDKSSIEKERFLESYENDLHYSNASYIYSKLGIFFDQHSQTWKKIDPRSSISSPSTGSRDDVFEFFKYSAIYWPDHFRGSDDTKQDLTTSVLKAYDCFISSTWWPLLWKEKMQDDSPLQISQLGLAAFNGHENIVEMFLKRGDDVHAQDSDGNTAVFWATFFNHEKVVRILQRAGTKLIGSFGGGGGGGGRGGGRGGRGRRRERPHEYYESRYNSRFGSAQTCQAHPTRDLDGHSKYYTREKVYDGKRFYDEQSFNWR